MGFYNPWAAEEVADNATESNNQQYTSGTQAATQVKGANDKWATQATASNDAQLAGVQGAYEENREGLSPYVQGKEDLYRAYMKGGGFDVGPGKRERDALKAQKSAEVANSPVGKAAASLAAVKSAIAGNAKQASTGFTSASNTWGAKVSNAVQVALSKKSESNARLDPDNRKKRETEDAGMVVKWNELIDRARKATSFKELNDVYSEAQNFKQWGNVSVDKSKNPIQGQKVAGSKGWVNDIILSEFKGWVDEAKSKIGAAPDEVTGAQLNDPAFQDLLTRAFAAQKLANNEPYPQGTPPADMVAYLGLKTAPQV